MLRKQRKFMLFGQKMAQNRVRHGCFACPDGSGQEAKKLLSIYLFLIILTYQKELSLLSLLKVIWLKYIKIPISNDGDGVGGSGPHISGGRIHCKNTNFFN